MISSVFTNINGSLNEELYKDLPETTVGERIKKVRLRLHIDRIQFAKSIHCEIKTVVLWETNKIMPEATSIKKISDTYNIPLDYFHKYYSVYYNNPQEVFLEWKKKNGYTYKDLGNMITSSGTTVHHFVSGRYKLSYRLYVQLEEICVF